MKTAMIIQARDNMSSRTGSHLAGRMADIISILICLLSFVMREAPKKVIQRTNNLTNGSVQSTYPRMLLAHWRWAWVYSALNITRKKVKITMNEREIMMNHPSILATIRSINLNIFIIWFAEECFKSQWNRQLLGISFQYPIDSIQKLFRVYLSDQILGYAVMNAIEFFQIYIRGFRNKPHATSFYQIYRIFRFLS